MVMRFSSLDSSEEEDFIRIEHHATRTTLRRLASNQINVNFNASEIDVA